MALSAVTAFLVALVAPGGMLLLSESFVRHPRVLLYFGLCSTA
ncbi:putative membrane protein [Synechococcus sp. BIOS-E4-1]|nr:putative membrane protein [Synechococcus sp. BIOS-E4-1]